MPGLWNAPVDPTIAALVLSGGAAQGDFEVGVVRWLFENGFTPGLVVSTSVGSVNAVKLVEGGSIDPATLENIWLTMMNSNSDMYAVNPDFDLTKAQIDIQSLGQDWWLNGGGLLLWGVGFFALPAVSLALLAQTGIQLNNVQSALNLIAKARSILTLDPLSNLLHNPSILDATKVASSKLNLLMAAVSLETGKLRYVNQSGALLESDTKTPVMTVPALDPACKTLADAVAGAFAQLQFDSNVPDPDPNTIRQDAADLAAAQRDLQDCIRQHPNTSVPATVAAIDGVMASAAIPMVFPPVKLLMENYIDGGVRVTAPIGGALANGATNIWAVLTFHNQVEPAVDPISGKPIFSFDQANWISIANRAARDIMPMQITADNVTPLAAWGSAAVTLVEPEIDIHNGMSIDPGLIRIRAMHGYMRADDVNSARWLAQDVGAGTDYRDLVDEVSTALLTTDIVNLRYQIWRLEHAALGMRLNEDTGGTVLQPTRLDVGKNSWDRPSWIQLHALKRRLERLVSSRRAGWDFATGKVLAVGAFNLIGAVPENPEPSSNWWLQYEHHQAFVDDPNFGALPTPPPLWPDENGNPFTPLQRFTAIPEISDSPGTATVAGTAPGGGPVTAPGVRIDISCLTPGASIFVTFDGTDPVPGAVGGGSTFPFTGPFVQPIPITVKAVAVGPPLFLQSPVATLTI